MVERMPTVSAASSARASFILESMPVKTRRWNDGGEDDDGYTVLVCRYRPRGLPKTHETWDAWEPNLGPSKALLDAFHGKGQGQGKDKKVAPISWPEYARRYLEEMRGRGEELAALRARLAAGETVTLLCSTACVDPERCHRTLLAQLLLR
jgi:uncharacterized protein YeaO (DUF488 family)